MVVSHEFVKLLLVSSLQVCVNFFVLDFLRIHLSLGKFGKPPGLKIILTDFLKLESLGINLKSVFVFQVFLNPHPENILVNRQLHF